MTSKPKDKAPCGCCKRVVAFRNIAGRKARVRHKCPHGQWCITGDRLIGHHANQPRCLECLNERRVEEGLAPLVKKVRHEGKD